jgi:hypothetical protein
MSKRLIISEAEAERIGRLRTGGEPDQQFKVFSYRHKATNLTAFAVEIVSSGEIVSLT